MSIISHLIRLGLLVSMVIISIFITSCSTYYYKSQKLNQEVYLNGYNPKKNSNEFEIINKLQNNITQVKTYTKDSILIAIENFSDYEDDIYSGKSVYYYKNGKIKKEIEYDTNNSFHGELKSYYENGNLKRHDYYTKHVLDSGYCYDSTGGIISYTPYFIEPYIDIDVIQKNLVYPENLRRKNYEEDVVIGFLIDTSGIIQAYRYDNRNSIEFVSQVVNAALKYASTKPAFCEGIPEKCWIHVPTKFILR